MKWEDWELPYYATGIMAVVLLAVGLSAKRDTRIETWARKQALEHLAAEEENEKEGGGGSGDTSSLSFNL
jgi:hypothetical protein